MKMNKIWVRHTIGIIAVIPTDIMYVEGNRYGCTLCFCKKTNLDKPKTIITKNTLTVFEKELYAFGFIRCHRNFIINPRLIGNFIPEGSYILLNDDTKIPVSKRKKYLIINLINQLNQQP
jgi:two-component system LytT family response regulator